MKKIINVLLFLLLFTCLNVRAQDALSGYLETAAENNPGLKARFNEYMAALERVPQAGALPDPEVAFGYFVLPVETRVGPQQARLSATQMFPWFGSLTAHENSVEAMAKASFEQFEEARSKLYYDVKSTYYNLFFNKKAIGITRDNIKILNSLKNIAHMKVESGSASSVDGYRVEMEINDLENQLALLIDNSRTLEVKYNMLLNVDANSTILISDNIPNYPLADSKENILDSIYSNNNALSAFDSEIEGLQYQEKLASKEGLPKFSVGLDYTFVGKNNAMDANAGQDAFMFPRIGITVPLYRNKYRAKIQEAVYLQKAKTEEKYDKANTLTFIFEEVWKDYRDAERRVDLFGEQELLAKKSLSILESDYATNSRNFEEILRMERQLLKYALEHQKALADKEAAIAFIYYLQGQ